MMVVGSRFGGGNDEKEEIGSGTYHGEEEEEIESEEEQKQKDTTPLWKYVTRLGGGRGVGTTKFTCPHCTKTYTG